VADAAQTARAMWTLFEPIHAVTYFAPEARSAFEQAGLRGFWRGYFAGRAAPLGPVGAAVVSAEFFNFAPAFVGRVIPGVWPLREHRGDGHFAALAAADIDGCEAVVLRCGLDLRREDMQPIRGWTDEQWADAHARLADRGWVGPGGELTGAGRHAHADLEAATDRAAARPWARLGAETADELAALLTPLAQACAALMPYPSPIGVPAPGW
jgi:hypothetical protein